jgi:hypothetical protein
VEALDESAAAFYAKFEFQPFPHDPYHLAIALETVKKLFRD